jgi:U11/U12 small nuclear ribonucleoprotein SNRNP65
MTNNNEILSSEFRKKLFERINSISSNFNVNYPINPKIRYEYPEINAITIENIVNALVSCPKFYIQTLHLMNKVILFLVFNISIFIICLNFKMNLPCPLVSYVRTSRPLFTNTNQTKINSPVSSSESEIETEMDIDNSKRVLNEQINKSKPKRLKFQSLLKTTEKSKNEPKQVIQLSEVFESPDEINKEKLKQIKPIVYDRQIIPCETEGFAKILPINKQPSDFLLETEIKGDYITLNELEKNRCTISELKLLPVYKNYEKGDVNCKLYIKNLAKNVQISDLKYIFGLYVDWSNESEKNLFDIRLMQEGRMKGQAFITFGSETKAAKALNETNGYILFEKPLIVSFAKKKIN